MRDETDLSGLKLTIDLKRGTDPEKLMQKLYKMLDTYSAWIWSMPKPIIRLGMTSASSSADPEKLMQKLYKSTQLQDSFPCNFNILIARTWKEPRPVL